jgi:hypothetical protein
MLCLIIEHFLPLFLQNEGRLANLFQIFLAGLPQVIVQPHEVTDESRPV